MQIPVLVEALAGNGYQAIGGEPFGFTTVGDTREEALGKLRDLIEERLATGAQLTTIEVKPPEHPFAKYAGMWREDDPLIHEWKQAVEEYRRLRDEDPDLP
jgi:predicted RNase H-like HicB family nuclease